MADFQASTKLTSLYNEGMWKKNGIDNNAAAKTPGPFVSYPEIKMIKLEYGIILRSYKFRVKLGPSSGDISFTPTFSNVGSYIMSSVRQSEEMVCYLPPHYFSLHAHMEQENRLEFGIGGESDKEWPSVSASPTLHSSLLATSPVQEEPAQEMCALYIGLKEQPADSFLLMKYSVNVVCDCKSNAWKNALVSNENFLDCGNQPMTVLCVDSPIALSRHQHDYQAFGLQQEYYVNINVFDFSKAHVVPYEAQKIIARQHCSLQLSSLVVQEWDKPFDLNIKCKGGYSIGGHRNILSSRSSVFKTMLESDLKEGKDTTIHFIDLNAPTMMVVLHFIYTGELWSKWMDVPVEEIMYAADKYNLPELLSFFDHMMMAKCNFANALTLSKLAERYCLKNAKRNILKFIAANLSRVCGETVPLAIKRT